MGWLLTEGEMVKANGTFHHFSIKHADRYIREFATRNNNRGCDTVDVLAITAKSISGKLLPYKELVYDPTKC